MWFLHVFTNSIINLYLLQDANQLCNTKPLNPSFNFRKHGFEIRDNPDWDPKNNRSTEKEKVKNLEYNRGTGKKKGKNPRHNRSTEKRKTQTRSESYSIIKASDRAM